MDFELDDDQLALQRAAGDLLDDLSSPERVRAAIDTGDGYDRALWKAMVDQGWLGVELAEEHGGLGLGTVDAAVLLEQVGRHVAPAPFLPSLLALGALGARGRRRRARRRAVGGAAARPATPSACVAMGRRPGRRRAGSPTSR